MGQHHAREFASRGDLLDRARRGAAVGREEKPHGVAPRAPRLGKGRKLDAEDRVGHAQPRERREDVLLESCRGLLAGLVQRCGQRHGALRSLLQGLFRGGDGLVAVDDRREFLRPFVAQGDQRPLVGNAVLLLQGDQRVEAR